MAAVDVQNVRKIYKRDSQDIVVLDGLSLEVPEGEFVALMGPSGSGKTTLLNLIAGFDRPTSGSIRFSFASSRESPMMVKAPGRILRWSGLRPIFAARPFTSA